MSNSILSQSEYENFFNDVTNGIMGVSGAPHSIYEALQKYDLQIPNLGEYNNEFIDLIIAGVFERHSGKQPSTDEVKVIKSFLKGKGHENRPLDRKSTRLNSSHTDISRMPSSA